jgi:hypothetical protein
LALRNGRSRLVSCCFTSMVAQLRLVRESLKSFVQERKQFTPKAQSLVFFARALRSFGKGAQLRRLVTFMSAHNSRAWVSHTAF